MHLPLGFSAGAATHLHHRTRLVERPLEHSLRRAVAPGSGLRSSLGGTRSWILNRLLLAPAESMFMNAFPPIDPLDDKKIDPDTADMENILLKFMEIGALAVKEIIASVHWLSVVCSIH